MFLLTDAPVCKLLFLKFDVWIIQVVWASCHLNFRGNRLVWSLDDEKGRRWREERRFPRSLIHQKSLCHVLISWHLFTTYTILFIFNKKKERDRQIDTERKRESDKVRDRMKHERQKSVFLFVVVLLFLCRETTYFWQSAALTSFPLRPSVCFQNTRGFWVLQGCFFFPPGFF